MNASRKAELIGTPGEVFGAFLKLGITSFGGPIAHLGYFRDELVIRRRWVNEPAYAELVALCQFLPGPASSQVGFSLGLARAGPLGALAAAPNAGVLAAAPKAGVLEAAANGLAAAGAAAAAPKLKPPVAAAGAAAAPPKLKPPPKPVAASGPKLKPPPPPHAEDHSALPIAGRWQQCSRTAPAAGCGKPRDSP